LTEFRLVGGDGKWTRLPVDEAATACILVDIRTSNKRYCFGTKDVVVRETGTGDALHFVGAITNDPIHKESVDPFSRDFSVQSMSFEMGADYFPLRDIRKAGIVLQDVDVDVYWHITGRDYTLEQSHLLLSGKITKPFFDSDKWKSTFSVEDVRLFGERPFPPIAATQDLLTNLADEDSGKPYPVVVGAVKKLPVLDISGGSSDEFLVMQDRNGEFGAGGKVSAVYDGDEGALAISGQDNTQTDADGNTYYRVLTVGDAATTRDVTVDVTGHSSASPADAIRYLLSFFGDDDNIFDLYYIKKIDLAMDGVTLGLAFNDRSGGGVLDMVRNRVSSLLPLAMIQRGPKYAFIPLVWTRDVVKHLRTDINIIGKTASVTETERSSIFNNFVVKYSMSGFRGESTGCVTADKDSDDSCRVSWRRYGMSQSMDINAGDLADEQSARWLLNWCIETYSKMRVFVSYRCTLDAVDVGLWDTVMVTDDDEDWTDTMFKVIGEHRGTGPYVDFDLVSVDDYTDVYDVNK